MIPRLDRLAILADYLEQVVPTKPDGVEFDLFDWWNNKKRYNPVTNRYETCGTAGCAIGHACQIPEFQKLGLHLEGGTPILTCPGGLADYAAWSAAEEFFGLSGKQALYLFGSESYESLEDRKNPLAVASRIRGLIADHLGSANYTLPSREVEDVHHVRVSPEGAD